MASSKWKSWSELNNICNDRDTVFWGASNWVEQTLEHIDFSIEFILDNNPNNHGIEFVGMKVLSPRDAIKRFTNKPFVIITTVNYQSVIDELHLLGYVMGEDFCCTPLLNDRADKDELKSLQTKVLVSSPEHATSAHSGGGLYEIDVADHSVRKILSGKGRGLTKIPNGYAWIDMLRGIIILDANYQEQGIFELEPNCEPHGLFYDWDTDRLFVAQPGRDSVAIYSYSEQKKINEIFISKKWSINKKDNHHVNDLCVHGGSLFLSMFSFSGNWPNEVYDGGVLEIDQHSGEIIGQVMQNLWMPHSVQRFNGKLTILDSMRGELLHMSWKLIGRFSGFIRGLDHDGRYYYVGVSEHRYPEKLYGQSHNISMDAGMFILDEKTKMSRFIAMPQVTSIHSLVISR